MMGMMVLLQIPRGGNDVVASGTGLYDRWMDGNITRTFDNLIVGRYLPPLFGSTPEKCLPGMQVDWGYGSMSMILSWTP